MARPVDPLGTEPMDITIPEQPATQASELRKSKYVKPSGYGTCPVCKNVKAIGFVRNGGHFYWKVHDRATQGRGRWQCSASGLALCQLPPLDKTDYSLTSDTPTQCCCTAATRLERIVL